MSVVNWNAKFRNLTNDIKNGKKYSKGINYRKKFMKLERLWKRGKVNKDNIDDYTN